MIEDCGADKITEEKFFEIWKNICDNLSSALIDAWKRKSPKSYTSLILSQDRDSVVCLIKEKINEECCKNYDLHKEYYGCDIVYYETEKGDSDILMEDPIKIYLQTDNNTKYNTPTELNSVWLKKIRIHLEHENAVSSSWQEIAQICTTPGTELNVLITYPNNDSEIEYLKKAYCDILNGQSEDFHLLVIFGFLKNNDTEIEWMGYKFEKNELKIC